MRSKTIGLVAFAALVAMALVGASSAMAGSTLLCQNDTASLTPTAGECNAPTSVHLISVNAEDKAAPAEILTSLGITVKCNVLITGTLSANLVTNGPRNITIASSGLVYTNCTPCEVKVLEGGTLDVLKTGVELTQITATGGRTLLNCFLFFHCEIDAVGLIGHGLGPLLQSPANTDTGHITYSKAAVHALSAGCPTITLDALFHSLTKTYIRS